MKRHRQMQESLVDYVMGALSSVETANVEIHLAQCRSCCEECENLKEVLRAMPIGEESPAARQPEEYWNMFARRVDDRLTDRGRHPGRVRILVDEVAAYLLPRWKPVLATAGGLALLFAVLGPWIARPREGPPRTAGEGEATVVQAAQKDEVNEYFERSRTLLIGIANMPAEEGDEIDLSVERTAARSLIHTARYLEQKPIDSRSRELIHELERVLVELANLEEQADIPQVEMIRTGLQQQNLLFKIRMAENQKRYR